VLCCTVCCVSFNSKVNYPLPIKVEGKGYVKPRAIRCSLRSALMMSNLMSWRVANPSTSRSTRLVAFSTVELAVTIVEQTDAMTALIPAKIDTGGVVDMVILLIRGDERICPFSRRGSDE